jgi:metallo-beta-lactamase class B
MKRLLLSVFLFGFATHAYAQASPPNLPTKEDLAKDNNLFLSLARKMLKWDVAAEPVKIIGPLYFVGTQGLSAWLFATTRRRLQKPTVTSSLRPSPNRVEGGGESPSSSRCLDRRAVLSDTH